MNSTRRIIYTVLGIFLLSSFAVAQVKDPAEDISSNEYVPENEPGFIFRPTIGLGVGTFTFMGDVGNYNKGFHPNVSRLGYHLMLSNPLTKEIELNFYTIFGTISSSERSLTRNLNFQSQIRTGGMVLSYDFGHFLPEKRILEPFVFAGIESFEFLTKTDLFDAYGNRYYYWSDGSIRNIDESDPNAATAMIIHRDYKYETDVRESNLDGFGKYPERSWAIPVGIGFTLNLNQRWTLKGNTAMHFAFTDLVDGVSENSVGTRVGDKKNDRFLYTSFTLTYDLQRLGPPKSDKEEPIIDDEMLDYLAKDTVDSDKDLVVDFLDDCAFTPKGVAVDKRGCPLDKDKDLVPDFRDDELETPKGNYVDNKGVTLSDEQIYQRYLRYIDSTGQYVEFETIRDESQFAIWGQSRPKTGTKFVVVVGNEKTMVNPEDLRKLLSMKDFKTIKSNDTVYYVIGDYANIEEAIARSNELKQEGHNVEGVATANTTNSKDPKDNGTVTTISKIPDDKLPKDPTTSNTDDKAVLFRVQIGAFNKPVSPEVFKDVPGLLMVTGPDKITRYYSGVFTSYEKAAEHKAALDMKGYSGAFVVAYKEGERQKLENVGATLSEGATTTDLNIDEKTDIKKSVVDPGLVKYKILVGSYRNDIPTEVLDMFLDLGQVAPKLGDNGEIIYLYGAFSTKEEANAALKKAQDIGLKKSMIIGDFNGKIITAEEAANLLRH